MEKLQFRNARADELELRVGATNESGFSLLIYKTARTDANILDETVSPFNWQKRFYQVKNTMICEIGIYNEERKEWVWKGDAGDESNTEAIKGEASDSFKRAGFAWNICRALYSSPFIWVKKDEHNDPKKSHYTIKSIDYQNDKISKLVIVNDRTGQVVFSMGSTEKVSQTAQKPTQNTFQGGKVEDITKGLGDTFEVGSDNDLMCSAETKKKIQDLIGTYDGDKMARFKNYLKNTCGTELISELTEKQGQQLLKALGGR